MTPVDDYIEAHERLALLAIEATDSGDRPALEEIVKRADNMAMLLEFAIAHAEDRALRGGMPGPSRGLSAD